MSLNPGLAGVGGGHHPSLSAHSDVLSASVPDTESSLQALIEEIKRRGRLCVSSGDPMSADALYGKGIDVLLLSSSSSVGVDLDDDDEGSRAAMEEKKRKKNDDLAILRSNRSLVRLRMGRAVDALEDATYAIENDPNYVKAHWRRGQAASACGNMTLALSSFEVALGLDPNNKALRREVDAARERLAAHEEAAAAAAAAAAVAAEVSDDAEEATMVDGTEGTCIATKGPVTKETTTEEQRRQHPSSSSSSTSKEQIDESVFTKSDHVRGYKIRSDGKKTSFFDREISDDAKKLIGDIAPRKLENNGINGDDDDVTTGPMAIVAEGSSAWNKAGTWEERDVTPWAKETLSASVLSASYVLPESSPSPGSRASIIEVVKLDGSASHAAVRGKKKYIYEFSLTVRWEMALASSSSSSSVESDEGGQHLVRCRGEMTFPDVDGTVESGEGYDVVNYVVDGSTCPPGIGPLLDRFVRDGGLRDSLHGAIDDWVTLFRATY